MLISTLLIQVSGMTPLGWGGKGKTEGGGATPAKSGLCWREIVGGEWGIEESSDAGVLHWV